MKSTQLNPASLARLRARLKRAGISHREVAAAARVSKFLVSHVFADPPRAKSANVVAAAKRLLAAKIPVGAV